MQQTPHRHLATPELLTDLAMGEADDPVQEYDAPLVLREAVERPLEGFDLLARVGDPARRRDRPVCTGRLSQGIGASARP